MGIFGTFTGYLANFFLSPRTERGPDAAVPVSAEQVGADAGRAAQLRELLARSEASAAELRRLLDEDESGGAGEAGGTPRRDE